MNQGHVYPLFSEFMDGSLSPLIRERVKSHLFFCNHCRNILKELQDNTDRLKSLPRAIPSKELEARILKSAQKELESPAPKERTSMSPLLDWLLSFKGLALLATVVFGLFIMRSLIPPAHEAPSPVVKPTIPPKPVNSPETKKAIPMPAPAPSPSVAPIAPQTGWNELKGQASGFIEPLADTITGAKAWKRVWGVHVSGLNPQPPLPPVNFDTQEIVFICAGSKPTGGYSLEILKVENTEWEGKPARIVTYQIKTPPENAMKTMALTQPYVFRVVPKINGKTFFKSYGVKS